MVARRWQQSVLAAVDEALQRAKDGQPTVFVAEGDPGMGKSTLLEELLGRAAPEFQVLDSEGLETGTATPYGVLAGWGTDLTSTQGSDTLAPAVATQRLRDVVNAAARKGPVLLVLDDLQWADPESVEAVMEVTRRASGDRLLLAVGTRPLRPHKHPSWQRWIAGGNQAVRVVLSGLAVDDAKVLARDLRSDIDSFTAEALWKHTAGNPLFLASLLAEYEPGELSGMQVLPAPASFVQFVVSRMARLSEDAARLAQAVAVLGSGWSSVLDVAELGQVSDSAASVQSLVDAGLLELRRAGPTDRVRPTHALVRAAIYQTAPVATQRQLHARAAELVTGRGSVLDHRVAAADHYDDDLAAELEAYANEQHLKRSYRLAAHYWHAASAVSERPESRERRRLESLFDTVLSRDHASVHVAVEDIREAGDRVLAALVEGLLAVWERRQFEGVQLLSRAADSIEDSSVDARTRYRVAVLLAWARMQSGGPVELIQAALDQASSSGGKDPTFIGLELLTSGQIIARSKSIEDALAIVSFLPEAPSATPLEMTPALAWRGSLFGGAGRFTESAADLSVVTERVQAGQADINGGAMHALLGRAQWFAGQWPLARVNLRVAVDLASEYMHPMVAASAPLVAVADGDFVAADHQLGDARRLLTQAPWLEALDMLTVTEVIRCHAEGAARAEYYDPIRPVVRGLLAGGPRKNAVWCLHAALAAIWAHELDDAASCAHAVRVTPAISGWTDAVAEWLLGLIAESRGKGKAALGHLRTAVSMRNTELPLYRAHALLDHARLAHLLGDTATAARSLDLAAEAYQALGANSYVRRADELRKSEKAQSAKPTIALSDRERDVLTLLADGLSYAQIARDLFITQSTVSYHLGNIYAKANVGSRHQLTDLVRADPVVFGLNAVGAA